MFHVYQHHDLDTLASLLAALLEREQRGSPLTPDTVLVPNRGTARWLQAQLATAEGSAANLALPLPGRFVWQVLSSTLPGPPNSTDFERGALVWHLYALLPSVDVPAVQRYLAGEPRERQRYQLAQRLAQVFDQYLIHRRDLLAAWETGREAGEPPADWQAPVWRALIARTHARHRAALMTEFLQAAAAGSLDTSGLPRTIHAFGLSELPPDYLRLLHALGHYVDVHFLLPNPSAMYWGDVRARRIERAAPGPADPGDGALAHPLLASLGRAGRDFLQVLYDDEFTDREEPDLAAELDYEPPGEATLLQRVQSGVIAGEAPTDPRGIEPNDVSIQIHACHGPLREIQVLHDRLLDLLTRHPDLEAREIVVLLPDVGRYAPAVHSVFGAATGPARLPYSVADRPRIDEHPIARTFQQVLELPLSRWTASEVLALVGVPAVRRRFGLGEDDLELIRHRIAAAGVRWGLDHETRARMGATAFEQNTWRFGLDRLLLGFAQQDGDTLVDGVAPWSDLEGGSAAAIGNLWLVLDRLAHWRDRLTESARPGAWQDRLNELLADLFATDPEDTDEQTALELLHDAIAGLGEATRAMPAEELSWEAVREALLGSLAAGSERQPLVSGGITFCGLEPLRGVPFGVVCLLGLDDDAFPRQEHQREFNLVQKQPRAGDPSVDAGDRMAFLQSLMAARRCFYLSYTGRDVQDGSPLQPSPVIGELLDYLHRWHFVGWERGAFRDALLTEQPMHPFSAACFDAERPRCFTFARAWRDAADAQQGRRAPPTPFLDDTRLDAPDAAEPVDLADLTRFFGHPARYFLRERLGLELAAEAHALDDQEPLGLSPLEAHGLRTRLFEHATRAGLRAIEPGPSALERARGQLPPAPLGAADYAPAAEAVNALLPLYWRWQAEAAEEIPIDVDVMLDGGTRLRGRAGRAGPAEMRRLRPGRMRLSQRLSRWLEYLAAVAAGHALRLRLAGLDKQGEAVEYLAEVDQATARDHLAAAVACFRAGHARPLLFTPDLAERYLEEATMKGGETRPPEDILESLNGWLSQDRQPAWPREDPWLRPLFGEHPRPLGTDPANSTLVDCVSAVAAPAWHAFIEVAAEAAGEPEQPA